MCLNRIRRIQEANEKKQAEKKKFTEAVQKHKKGMQAQLENMLNNVKRQGLDKVRGRNGREMNEEEGLLAAGRSA